MVDHADKRQPRRNAVDAVANSRLPTGLSLLVIGGLSAISWMTLIALIMVTRAVL
jgi:hypothetical protein